MTDFIVFSLSKIHVKIAKQGCLKINEIGSHPIIAGIYEHPEG